MAAAKKVASLIVDIDSEEAWEKMLEDSEKRLILVDVYKTWSGPCVVMRPTYEKVFLENEECEKRLLFATADPTKVPQLAEYAESQTCKPLFLFYKGKTLLGKVQGANAPEITGIIADNIPEVPEE